MARFVFAYRGGSMPEGEEAQKAVMDAWMSWFGQLGPAVADGGAPFAGSTTVTGSGGGDGPAPSALTGFSIVAADDLGAAAEMAKGCPVLTDGGSVDVYEAIDMM
jgi:hypothetical protein